MKQILCFGDSNTHGFDAMTCGRFDYHTRWTGVLNEALGKRALICEAGLNGRTCAFEDPDVPGRNGLASLDNELQTHKPLDAVVVMLGTNDCKFCFQADGANITQQMEKVLRRIQQITSFEGHPAKILLVAPVPLNRDSSCCSDFNLQSVTISQSLSPQYRRLAQRLKAAFADAGAWNIPLDFDGIHFTPEGHRRFAQEIQRELEALLEL